MLHRCPLGGASRLAPLRLDLDPNGRCGYLPDRLSRHMHVLRSKNAVRPRCREFASGALVAPPRKGGLAGWSVAGRCSNRARLVEY